MNEAIKQAATQAAKEAQPIIEDCLFLASSARAYSAEEAFYYVLCSAEGGRELYLRFVKIWNGVDKEAAEQAVEFFTSGNLAMESEVSIEGKLELGYLFINSIYFHRRVAPWFQGITCDGERASRTLLIFLSHLLSFVADFSKETH